MVESMGSRKTRMAYRMFCYVMVCSVYYTLHTSSLLYSDILGDKADIHTGGVDLKFPHHDNEIAQAEVPHNVTIHYSQLSLFISLSLSVCVCVCVCRQGLVLMNGLDISFILDTLLLLVVK